MEMDNEIDLASSLGARKFIIITDLEPDDRIALLILAARISQDKILFIGTTVMHAAKKKALTRRLLDQVGFNKIQVWQGTGGIPTSYHDIASSKAAREYMHEGAGILSPIDLEKIDALPRSSNELQEQIEKALRENDNIEFIVLAPPTDLVETLEESPDLKKNIKHIFIMGGWTETYNNLNEEMVSRTTYNWNMDPIASAKLMNMQDISMTLYSSHTIKNNFGGGSINSANFPQIIELINTLNKQKVPSFIDQETAGLSWDDHIIDKIPALGDIIGPYKGNQFTPSDPAVIIGILNNNFIKRLVPVSINIDTQDKDAKGFRVYVACDNFSKINLVESIDIKIFEEELLKSLKVFSQQV